MELESALGADDEGRAFAALVQATCDGEYNPKPGRLTEALDDCEDEATRARLWEMAALSPKHHALIERAQALMEQNEQSEAWPYAYAYLIRFDEDFARQWARTASTTNSDLLEVFRCHVLSLFDPDRAFRCLAMVTGGVAFDEREQVHADRIRRIVKNKKQRP